MMLWELLFMCLLSDIDVGANGGEAQRELELRAPNHPTEIFADSYCWIPFKQRVNKQPPNLQPPVFSLLSSAADRRILRP